ncbi:hypothetical protein [Catellatospora tritici]|uniref:hypothetical protein n=1 Tax=Catellatospora tritici TaxID=2851566 RepID=UPI001C2CD8C8|nr:hypothetical protein [Catellatospora tritici]MBV1850632.1 hypothetical protein [Catellatospora tritici]
MIETPPDLVAVLTYNRARRVALVTPLGWNVPFAVSLLAVVVWIFTAGPGSTGQGWGGFLGIVLAIVGGGALFLATSLGTVAAVVIVTHRLRSKAVGAWAAFGFGTLATLLGWLAVPVAWGLFLLWQHVTG